MKVSEYQKLAMVTRNNGLNKGELLLNAGLGLTSEAGEIADHLKKHFFQGHGLDKDNLVKEAGDVLWYVALLCETLNVSMEYVMEMNIEKLKKRYPDGYFKSSDSINRDTTE